MANLRELIPTGIDGLDQVLRGGVLKGNVVLIEGMPGTGKTTLALEFLYRGAKDLGEPGLLINFETSPEKIIRDAQGFGWNLEELQAKGLLKLLSFSPSVLMSELQNSESLLLTELRSSKAKRVVIDSLTPLKLIGDKVNGGLFRESFHLLIQTLIGSGATPLLITEVFETHAIGESGASQEQFLCDTILTLRNQARRRSVHRSIEVTKSRGQDFIAGRHSLNIENGTGAKVYPRVYARSKIARIQPSSTERTTVGNPVLDSMLGGGAYRGSITLIVGISGTGKTIVGTQFLVDGAEKGETGLLVTLDEYPEQILRNTANLGVDLKTPMEADKIRMFYESPLELDLDQHFYSIKNMVEKFNVKRVVIDSLAAYKSAQPEDAHEFLVALSSFFKERLIVAFFNFECPELLGVSQISDELKASAIVDNIILLNYVEISTLLRRAITVPKARGSKPDQRTREYVVQQGGIFVLDDRTVEDVDRVPQLPLSSYYSVLARSPTRKSPVIDEHLAAGKELPKSRVPKPGARKVKVTKSKSARSRA